MRVSRRPSGSQVVGAPLLLGCDSLPAVVDRVTFGIREPTRRCRARWPGRLTARASGPPMLPGCAERHDAISAREPAVPREPTRSLWEAGIRIEPQVSLPIPATAKFAATAAPVPPLDPPGFRSGSYGFQSCPPKELMVVIPAASS